MCTDGTNPVFSLIESSKFNWAMLDLNQCTMNQRIYKPPPLSTRATTINSQLSTEV